MATVMTSVSNSLNASEINVKSVRKEPKAVASKRDAGEDLLQQLENDMVEEDEENITIKMPTRESEIK